MPYVTIVYFEDLQDNSHPYNPGDPFPRKGKRVSKKRLEELSTKANRRGIALIEKVEEPKPEAEAPAEEPAAE